MAWMSGTNQRHLMPSFYFKSKQCVIDSVKGTGIWPVPFFMYLK